MLQSWSIEEFGGDSILGVADTGRVKPGIYRVRFSGGYSQNFGDGIAVITDKAINGGDPGYFWSGLHRITKNRFSAKIHVKRWKDDVSNPIANLAEYDLVIEGQVPDDWSKFSAQGHIKQYPSTLVTLTGERLGDAA